MAAAKTDDDAVDKGSNSEIGSSKMKGKGQADHSDGKVDEETNILQSLFDAQGIHVSFLYNASFMAFLLEICPCLITQTCHERVVVFFFFEFG